jgi:hypothetical protein
MSWKCKLGIHNFDRRRIEFSIYSPSDASIVELCDCGKRRLLGRELPTVIVQYETESSSLRTKWVRVFDDTKCAKLKVVS